MRFMVIIKASEASEAGVMPSQQLFEEMGRFNEELAAAGVLLAADGLHPSSKGVRVRIDGKKRSVIDGPFAETKELIAGFWIMQTRSLDEVIEWVKRIPNPDNETTEVEIRQIYDEADFAEVATPEQLERVRRLDAQATFTKPS
ncbi:MAG: YciI family protein [Longimicrobiales bacterium]